MNRFTVSRISLTAIVALASLVAHTGCSKSESGGGGSGVVGKQYVSGNDKVVLEFRSDTKAIANFGMNEQEVDYSIDGDKITLDTHGALGKVVVTRNPDGSIGGMPGPWSDPLKLKGAAGSATPSAAAAGSPQPLSGTYQCNMVNESFEFSKDGKVKLHDAKSNFEGTYVVEGKQVTVTLPDPPPPMIFKLTMNDSGDLVPPADRQPPGGGVKYAKQ